MNKYDDYISIFGHNTFNKIVTSTVLIYGSESMLRTEVIKNLESININIYDNNYYVSDYKYNYNVIIIINESVEKVEEISNYCRDNNIKLVVLWSKGLSGIIFVDAINHIFDKGYNIEPIQISNITETGIVHCITNHNLQSEDYVIFSNLDGITLENEWKIDVINKNTFQLNNFKIEKFKFINGTVNYINRSIEINHKQFNQNINDPLIKTYLQMFNNNLIDKMPPLWTTENDIFMNRHNIIERNQARLFHHEIIPIVSFFGSLAALEVLKLVSNKFTPISQWFSWTDETLIPKNKISYNYKTTFGLFYGEELENKLINSEWLVIGSGIIAQEHIKNLELMKLNVITNQEIKENLTGVLMATNHNTKKVIAEQCFKYNIPLFDAGINRLLGHIQPIIPFITDTFSTLNDFEQDKSYPICVINSFPNDINHTISWAIEQFEFFIRAPKTLNNWLLNSNYINTLEENDKIIAEKDINLFTVKYPTQLNGLQTCYTWAIDMFNDYFFNSINHLLGSFPNDVPFWENGKRCPKPIRYDNTIQEHIDFIEATVELLKKCCEISKDIYFKPIYISQELESNIKWITAISNMRALNYSIPICNNFRTREIALKIIPSTIITGSIVSGLTILEVLKYLINLESKLSFINLSESIIIQTDPINASMINIGNNLVNSWTKFEYKKDTSLKEFKHYYEIMFETTISMIVIDTTIIYADFLGQDILDKKISEIISKNTSFTLLSIDDKEIPIISVIL